MDRSTFVHVVLKHRERLWGYALRLTRNSIEAEDLVQLTYLRAFEHWTQLREAERACSWLIRTMHRAFVDRYRRRVRAPLESLDGDESAREHLTPTVSGPEPRAEARDALEKALRELAAPLAQALALRDVWGFAYEEIAELMDCPVGTVRSRIARARAQMLETLRAQADTSRSTTSSAARREQGEAP